MNVLAQRTAVTPEVVLDPAAHALSVRGECYPENPILFFGPIFAALEVHLGRAPVPAFQATFRLSYVNSASTKALRRLLTRLERLGQAGTKVEVVWEHERDDDGALELGRDLADDLHHLDLVERPFDLLAAG